MNHAGEPVGSKERGDWFSDECRATEQARRNRDYIPKQGLLFAHVLPLVLFLIAALPLVIPDTMLWPQRLLCDTDEQARLSGHGLAQDRCPMARVEKVRSNSLPETRH